MNEEEEEEIKTLKARLKKTQEKKTLRLSPPQPVPNPNFERLIAECKTYMESLVTGKGSKDPQESIFETAMKTIFGEDVFEWINAVDD